MLFLDINDTDFDRQFSAILTRGEETSLQVTEVVRGIIQDIRSSGDDALLEYTNRFDRLGLADAAGLEITADEIEAAVAAVPADDLAALQLACERVARFHEKQKQQTWLSTEEPDILLGQKVTPLNRVLPHTGG